MNTLKFWIRCFLSVFCINDVTVFWEICAKILKGGLGTSVLQLIAKIIRKHYACAIPISQNIMPFNTPHGFYGIFISKDASIGNNCTILQSVTIGTTQLSVSCGEGAGRRGAPSIGNNCLIGAGAVIVGKIKVGNNVRIGAGAVVSLDVPDNNTVVMNHPRIIPAKE